MRNSRLREEAAAIHTRQRAGAGGALSRWPRTSLSSLRAIYRADHLIHAWDLARAIGADERLDTALAASSATWFNAAEDAYRSADAIAERPPVPGDADAQTVLLAASAGTPEAGIKHCLRGLHRWTCPVEGAGSVTTVRKSRKCLDEGAPERPVVLCRLRPR